MSLLNQVLRDLASRRGRERDDLSGVTLPGAGSRMRSSGWRRAAGFAAMVVVLTGSLLTARVLWLDGSSGSPPQERATDATAPAKIAARAGSAGGVERPSPGDAQPGAEDGATEAVTGVGSRLAGIRRGTTDGASWWELRFDGPFRYETASAGRRWGLVLNSVPADGDLPAFGADGSRVRSGQWRRREGSPLLVLETAPGVRIETSRPGGAVDRLRLTAVGRPAGGNGAAERSGEPDDASGTDDSPLDSDQKPSGNAEAAEMTEAMTEAAESSGASPNASSASTAGGERGRMDMRTSEPRDAALARQRYRDARRALERGNRATAEADLAEALELDPEHHDAREMLVAVLIRSGRLEEAAERLDTGGRLAPERSGYRRLAARVTLQRQGPAAALAELETEPPAVRSDPEYHALMAALYQQDGQHREALRTYRALLEVRPRHGPWWAASGISLERMGRDDNALEAYRRSRRAGGMPAELREYVDSRVAALDGKPEGEER